MATRFLLLAGVLFATSTAAADAPHYKRPQNLVVEVKLSDRTKPTPQTTLPPTKPATADDILLIEEHNAPLREEQERILAELVKDTPDTDPDKADLLFRLAEHYAKQQRFWRLKSMTPEASPPPPAKPPAPRR